mmetsp:Transcript_24150/g.64729  ORF Transcript_24150/g.64729 Transcript_24150/m.64729 type:complete len:98 (-) Transcript_24150:73-366(-)
MTPQEMMIELQDVSSIVKRLHRSVECRFAHVAYQQCASSVDGSQLKRPRKYRLAAIQFKALAKYGDRMAKIPKKRSLPKNGAVNTIIYVSSVPGCKL